MRMPGFTAGTLGNRIQPAQQAARPFGGNDYECHAENCRITQVCGAGWCVPILTCDVVCTVYLYPRDAGAPN
jgi:hypothetical protein